MGASDRFTHNVGPELRLGPVDALRVENTIRSGSSGAFATAGSPSTLILSEPEER